MKGCSTSLFMGEMPTKTTLHLYSGKTAVKKTDHTKCWGGAGGPGTLHAAAGNAKRYGHCMQVWPFPKS